MKRSISIWLLVFLSGMTALIYQVSWQKLLSHHLGSQARSTALVLAAFFACLALGYAFFGKWLKTRREDRMKIFFFIEVLFVFLGTLSFFWYQFLSFVMPVFPSASALGIVADFAFALLLIGPATFLMGGTLPVLTEAFVIKEGEARGVHAYIYGWNTLGAFLGALLTGLFFIEHLGLAGAILVAVLLNFLNALLARRLMTGRVFENKSEKANPPSKLNWGFLSLALISGVVSFTLETILIRMAGQALGSSNYTYSTIVSAFILSLGLANVIFQKIKSSLRLIHFYFFQLAALLTTIALYLSIPKWPALFLQVRHAFSGYAYTHDIFWWTVLFVFSSILVIPVGLIGVQLPLLFDFLQKQKKEIAGSVGQIYSWNAVGSVLGAILGGYVAYFFFQADEVFKGVLYLQVIALTLTFLLLPKSRYIFGFFVAAPLIASIIFLPNWDAKEFVPGLYSYQARNTSNLFSDEIARIRERHQRNEILFREDGPNTSTVVLKDQRGKGLYVNGRIDAHETIDSVTRSLNILTPLTLAPQPKRVFLVGLGAGLSQRIASGFSGVEEVKIAEIAPSVIEAHSFFEKNYEAYISSDKVEILSGDAFRILRDRQGSFDVIVNEPSTPWVSGVDQLFTIEFYQTVFSKLSEQGVFYQWMTINEVPPESFLKVVKTFVTVFPNATLWSSGGGAIALLGSKKKLQLNQDLLSQKFENNKATYQKLLMVHPLSILGNQLATDATLRRMSDSVDNLQSLYRPFLAFESERAVYSQIRTNLDQIFEKVYRAPLKQKQEKFFYENFELTPEFFQTTRRMHSQFLIWNMAKERLSILEKILYPESRSFFQDAEGLAHFKYLLDEELPIKDYSKREIKNLLLNYRILNRSQISVSSKRITELLKDSCSEKECSQNKLLFLQNHYAQTELDNFELGSIRSHIEIDSQKMSQIEILFEATIKKLNH